MSGDRLRKLMKMVHHLLSKHRDVWLKQCQREGTGVVKLALVCCPDQGLGLRILHEIEERERVMITITGREEDELGMSYDAVIHFAEEG